MFSTRWYCHPFIFLLASCSSVLIRDAFASKEEEIKFVERGKINDRRELVIGTEN